MHPVLFELGPIPIRAYGLLVMVGFLTGAYLTYRRAPRTYSGTELSGSHWRQPFAAYSLCDPLCSVPE